MNTRMAPGRDGEGNKLVAEMGNVTDVPCAVPRSTTYHHGLVLTLQPAGSSMGVLVPDQPSLRTAPAEVPQHPQQLDEHQRDEVGEQVALADAHGVHSPGEGEQQPGQEEVDAVLAAEDLGVFLRVAAAHGGGTGGFLHLPRRQPGAARRWPRVPREDPRPSAGPSPIGSGGRSGAAAPAVPPRSPARREGTRGGCGARCQGGKAAEVLRGRGPCLRLSQQFGSR